jgi:hypothetical protein
MALAQWAGQTVAASAVTDVWEAARHRVARLLGHGDPGKTELAEQWLDETHQRGLPYRYFGPVVPTWVLLATWGFTEPEVILPGTISATDLASMKIAACECPGGHE